MAVPKRKVSRMRRGNRRSQQKLNIVRSRECPHCGEHSLPHRMCGACGYYRSREVIATSDS